MRVVVKLGTAVLTHPTGRLDIRRVRNLCTTLSDLMNAGHQLVLVSSGAIGMGVGKLNLQSRPTDLPTKQAAAAVGQCELMYVYDQLFSEYHYNVAQILLTADDMAREQTRQNYINTILRLLDFGALPIINENDTVATEELGIGDNDTLSAHVASSIGADLLILLSDIDGLYTADPHKDPNARLLHQVEEITPEILALGGSKGSSLAVGGMVTKLKAAQMATAAGCDMVIANGNDPSHLYDILEGKDVGTRFLAKRS